MALWCVPKELVQTQYFARPATSEVKRTLKKGSMFRCKNCKGEGAPTDSLNLTQVHVGEDTFKAVPTFQYYVNVVGELGGPLL